MLTIGIFSDLHPMDHITTGGVRLEGDCLYAIQQIEEYLNTIRLDAAFFPGDLLDAVRADGSELKLLKKLFDVIDKHQIIPKFMIQGNHDKGLVAIPEVCFQAINLDGLTVQLPGTTTTIAGIKYQPDQAVFREKLKNTAADILICHVSMQPFANFESEHPITPDDFPDNVLAFVGDTHLTQVYENPARGQTIVSPGFLYPTDKTEFLHGQPGFTVLVLATTQEDQQTIGGRFQLFPFKLNKRAALNLVQKEGDAPAARDSVAVWADSLDADIRSVLKPVVYVRKDRLDDYDWPEDVIQIPVNTANIVVDTDTDYEAAEASSIVERIRQVVGVLLSDDRDQEAVTALCIELMGSDKPASVLSDYVERILNVQAESC